MKVAVSSRHYRIVAQKGTPNELQFGLELSGDKSANPSLEATIASLLTAIEDILKCPPPDMPLPTDDGKVAPSEAVAKEIVVDLEEETEVGEDLVEEEAQDEEDEENDEEKQDRVQGVKQGKQAQDEKEYELDADEDGKEEEEMEEDDGEDVEECDDEGNVIVPGKKLTALANRRRQRSRSVARQRSRSAARRRSASPKPRSRSRPKKQKMGFAPKNPLEKCYAGDVNLLMEREYDGKQEVLDEANQVAQ
jgi:hypothetical protein